VIHITLLFMVVLVIGITFLV